MGKWNELSLRERADLINTYLDGGVLDLKQMKEHYNSFGNGGDKSYSPSQSIKDYIKKTEAFRSDWYKDGNGVPTVGYGFTGDYFKQKYPNGMTREEADKEFDRVIQKFALLVKQHTPNYDSLSQNQKDSLLSYMYNVGPGNYTTKSPKFQQALRDKDWNAVAQNMDIGYNDQKNRGLRKRRDYERALFLGNSSTSSPSVTQYYDDYKAQSMASPVPPEAGQATPIGMPSLYYNPTTYKDVDFSTPLTDFNYPGQSFTPIPSSSRRRTAAVTQPSSIPTNEKIIGDLFSQLNSVENVFEGGGDTASPIGKPLYWNPESAENTQIPLKAYELTQSKPSRAIPELQLAAKAKSAEQQAFMQDVLDNLSTSKITEQLPMAEVEQNDTFYKPVDSRVIEAKVLGDSDKKIAQDIVRNLKSEDDIKQLQKELYEKGYLKADTPKIKAKTKGEIIELQRRLKDAGYDIGNSGKDKDGIDGILGSKTRAAWERYNQEHSDEAALDSVMDGKIGSKTRRAIMEYANNFKDVDVNELSVSNPLDLKQYDKILKKQVTPSFVKTVSDGIDDKRNLSRWKKAVEKARENNQYDEDGIPYVNMNWKVSNDALSRAVSLLPKGLNEYSQTDWITSDKKEGNVRYPRTWDNPEYLEENKTKLVEFLNDKEGIFGLAGQALASPGRSSIGGFAYRTTPYGIEISDGYEFYADPKKVVINDTQTDAYNDVRSQMNVKYRAKNKTSQRYFIPWEVYNKFQTKN